MLTYDDLTERISRWVHTTEDVRAALLLGSRARTDHPADDWSDLDVLVFARNPDQFVKSGDWATRLAPAWLSFCERAGDGTTWERRTMYDGGLQMDVAFIADDLLARAASRMPRELEDILRRGVRIIVDKDGGLGRIAQLPLFPPTAASRPDPDAFANATADFWYHAVWSAQHLRRGELWWAKGGVDGHLKGLLQQMLAWHARASRGDGFDTWLRGRFLEEWADPRAVAQLRDAYAHYDAQDVRRALDATMRLYRWLEDETAQRWGIGVSREGEDRAAELARALLTPL